MLYKFFPVLKQTHHTKVPKTRKSKRDPNLYSNPLRNASSPRSALVSRTPETVPPSHWPRRTLNSSQSRQVCAMTVGCGKFMIQDLHQEKIHHLDRTHKTAQKRTQRSKWVSPSLSVCLPSRRVLPTNFLAQLSTSPPPPPTSRRARAFTRGSTVRAFVRPRPMRVCIQGLLFCGSELSPQ